MFTSMVLCASDRSRREPNAPRHAPALTSPKALRKQLPTRTLLALGTLLLLGSSGCRLDPEQAPAPPLCDWPTLGDGAYLLSISPGEPIFTAFGHNAIYLRDTPRKLELVFAFGAFVDSPDLLRRFLLGTADAMLVSRSLQQTTALYQGEKRRVVAQRLSLGSEQFSRLEKQLRATSQTEQRNYRYHWFEQNCSTKLRDLLDGVSGGALQSAGATSSGWTARDEILWHVADDLPMWFALEYALGGSTEQLMSAHQRAFIPSRLSSLAHATAMQGGDGLVVPLAAEPCLLLDGRDASRAAVPARRSVYMLLFGLLPALALLLLNRPPTWTRALAAAVMAAMYLLFGLLGSISVWVWGSQGLPALSANANLFLANPGHILGLVIVFCFLWGRGAALALALACLFALSALLGSLLIALGALELRSLSFAAFALPFQLAVLVTAWRRQRLQQRDPLEPLQELPSEQRPLEKKKRR